MNKQAGPNLYIGIFLASMAVFFLFALWIAMTTPLGTTDKLASCIVSAAGLISAGGLAIDKLVNWKS